MIATNDKIRFQYEWEPGDGVRAEELAATWARIELWVGDECVTQVEDRRTGSARRSVYAPLYPLAEWIAFNWWSLQANVRPASQLQSSSWFPRRWDASWMPHHNVRGAGDGFAWPNLVILPEGGTTRLVWQPDRATAGHAPVRYLSRGQAWLGKEVVELALAQVVESVLARLEEQGVTSSPLVDEWQAVVSADREEREFCLSAARLGLDPYNIDAGAQRLLEEADARLNSELLGDFLDSVTPSRISEGLDWVNASLNALDHLTATPSAALETLRADIRTSGTVREPLPWVKGYRQAAVVRSTLSAAQDVCFEFGDMISLKKRRSDDRGLQGLGGLSQSGAAGLVIGRSLRKPDARFAEARALWHLTYDDSPERFLLTSSHADRQRVERAFAAELLAPAAGVRDRLVDESGLVTMYDIEDVAEHYQVSPLVVRHQVENQLNLQIA